MLQRYLAPFTITFLVMLGAKLLIHAVDESAHLLQLRQLNGYFFFMIFLAFFCSCIL